MPRGVKGTVNYDAELAKLEAKIEKHKQSIKSLEAAKDAINSKKRDQEMQQIYTYMNKTGITAQEILEKISE